MSIKQVAEATGLAAGTIRMWEQRYGFPVPTRTDAGYRLYTGEDVGALQRAVAYRHRGMSVSAAVARAVETGGPADHPSIYAAVASTDHGARPQLLRKATLVALSRAIEHETMSQSGAALLFGAFQHERFYRQVEPRYRRMSRFAEAAVAFADFPEVRHPAGGPVEIPVLEEDQLGNEWAVVVDAPGYAACLLAWELPGEDEAGPADDPNRRFEAIWTVDPASTRKAAVVAARLTGRQDPALGERLEAKLADRPLATDGPAPLLTSLTNRMVSYLEAAHTS